MKHIVIIEDDISFGKTVKALLAVEDEFKVSIGSLKEKDILSSNDIDLVVLDFNLVDSNGCEVYCDVHSMLSEYTPILVLANEDGNISLPPSNVMCHECTDQLPSAICEILQLVDNIDYELKKAEVNKRYGFIATSIRRIIAKFD